MNLAKKMDAGNPSGDRENSQPLREKRHYQRHTAEQIQRLESYFKECSNPDENQREELSKELGLDSSQVKFWFQNKRTQKKTHIEKEENYALRDEKDKLLIENIALTEALKNMMCPNCGGPGGGNIEERIRAVMLENAQLKEMIRNAAPGQLGIEEAMGGFLQPNPNGPLEDPQLMAATGVVMGLDKMALLEIAASAMNELVELLSTKEPVWVHLGADGRRSLHRETYERLFPVPSSSPLNSTNARIESSMDYAEVEMSGGNLFNMLSDADKWKEVFPTVVTVAKTIEKLDEENFGGSIVLMYEQVHVLSPHVAPRHFVLLRYCRQLSSNSWAIADVSFDLFKKVSEANPIRSWKFPSGCMIQDAPDGKSIVKWVEHVQVEDKPPNHRLYKDLVRSSQAYGARRWIASLRATCERLASSMEPNFAPKHEPDGVIRAVEGRSNLMRLSHRMVMDFSEALNMSDEFDFSHMSELTNSGFRVSLRKNVSLGRPDGLVLGAAMSLWLPLPSEAVFNFFNDETLRALWDVLASGAPANALAHIPTGSQPGNRISIIQPYLPKGVGVGLSILQETLVGPLGAMLVYAPIEMADVTSVINGRNPDNVKILPSGFVISGDGRAGNRRDAGRSGRGPEGSLLTVVMQILVSGGQHPSPVSMETVANVHSLVSSTVQNIRSALDCAEASAGG